MNAENIFVKSIVAQNIIYSSGPFAPHIISYFKEYGIDNILENEYINLNILFNVFRKISFQFGTNFLFNIGKTLSISINFLNKKFNNLKDLIDALNDEYHQHHYILSLDNNSKKKILGDYSLINIDKNQIHLKSSSLYPCEFDKGLLYKVCLYFYPNLHQLNIEHFSKCKNLGSNYCDYLIKFKQTSNV